jgi:hypothetical protein
MQDQEGAGARREHNPAPGQADQNAATKSTRLAPAIPLCEELIMKEGNGFVVANLLDPKVRSEALLQEVQRRPLQPIKEIGRRQQHSCGSDLVGVQRAFVYLLDLPIGELVEIDEEK